TVAPVERRVTPTALLPDAVLSRIERLIRPVLLWLILTPAELLSTLTRSRAMRPVAVPTAEVTIPPPVVPAIPFWAMTLSDIARLLPNPLGIAKKTPVAPGSELPLK